MKEIYVLDSITVDKIAAGEVVERPASVVKELVENAIDANADSITIEAKDGGASLIRVTDNGSGIAKEQITKAFCRHATSKIRSIDDLNMVKSLGFRGEALSSISSVCQVELITKTQEELIGTRAECNGGVMGEIEEVGAPNGTTILARNIFYNTPVRKKFLKSNMTEGSYITDLIEHFALSNPTIAFKYILNGQTKFFTSGNGNLTEVIYRIYGKDISDNLIPVSYETEGLSLSGYLGKPILNRSNRNFETFFVNGRYIKSKIISKAIEEGYKSYLMQHKFPFVVLHFLIDTDKIDVNVHPTKMDIRMNQPEQFINCVTEWIQEGLSGKNLIPEEKEQHSKQDVVGTRKKEMPKIPEPFETQRITKETPVNASAQVRETSNYEGNTVNLKETLQNPILSRIFGNEADSVRHGNEKNHANIIKQKEQIIVEKPTQMALFEDGFFTQETNADYKILGQVFDTYWLILKQDTLYFMDQHAAHEKVKYEAFVKRLKNNEAVSQALNPPIVLTMNGKEQETYFKYADTFITMGFEVEEFGGNEYALRSVPSDLYGYGEKELFLEVLDELMQSPSAKGDNAQLEKIASMACKAAVKGNMSLSSEEAKELIDTLFTLENPYHCPHGRPIFFSISKYEMEKKFKRIVT